MLEGEDAIAKNREVMGATNPAEAADGTIRKEFALSIGENSVHGSDGPDTAATEIAFFFVSAVENVALKLEAAKHRRPDLRRPRSSYPDRQLTAGIR